MLRFLLLISFTLLAGCFDEYGWNQKLTVTVQTPEGPVSASSVTRVTMTETDAFWVPHEARGVQSRLEGEAVVLEVQPGKFLFVLLAGVDHLAAHTFPEFDGIRDFGDWARAIQEHEGVGIVPPEKYPMMVMFEDISDPTSVRLVEPDDLASAFGEGVRLQEMTLTITDEVSDETISRVLPWLTVSPEAPIISEVDPFDFSVAATLRVGDFIRG